MIKNMLLICCLCFTAAAIAQQSGAVPLPVELLKTLNDSTTSIDLVLLQGEGGSILAEGNNVRFFNSFIDNRVAQKTESLPAGTMMWLNNGRELISGNYYLGDSTGYIVFKKDGKEFVNVLNAQGNTFLKSEFK